MGRFVTAMGKAELYLPGRLDGTFGKAGTELKIDQDDDTVLAMQNARAFLKDVPVISTLWIVVNITKNFIW